MDDRQLVQAVHDGAAGAFERLVRTHQATCWRIILRVVRDPEHARDLCQETFLRVHQRLHQFRGDSALGSWIGRIAFSLALRHLERQRGRPPAPGDVDADARLLDQADPGIGPDRALVDEHRRRRLAAAIEALPAVPRSILRMHHVDELPIPDIARITGLKAGTIKSHLFRSRQRLRELLDDIE